MLGLRFSPKAKTDLDEIWLYTLETWGSSQAKDYLLALGSTVELLRTNPQMGVSLEGIRPGYRRMSTGSHSIIYRFTKTDIDIIRILHKNMDVDGNL